MGIKLKTEQFAYLSMIIHFRMHRQIGVDERFQNIQRREALKSENASLSS